MELIMNNILKVHFLLKNSVAESSKKRSLVPPSKGTRVNLANRFPCKARVGMSAAIDTAWQKRGFNSMTGIIFKQQLLFFNLC